MQAPEPTTDGAAGPRVQAADVLVVGAGPAGSTAAADLARAGLGVPRRDRPVTGPDPDFAALERPPPYRPARAASASR